MNRLSYRVKMAIDVLLPLAFGFFGFLWLIQSAMTIFSAGTFFVAVHLWIVGFSMHAVTALNLSALFLVNFFFFRTFMPGHQRVVRALLFTLVGVFFYDAIWSMSDVLITGSGSFILPLASFLVVLLFMVINDRQQKILRFNLMYILPIVYVYVVTLAIFVWSGFFQEWSLYQQGVATDPTSWPWLLNKTVALWMWLVIALR